MRKFSGIKYHRVTGRHEEKQFYDPMAAAARADEHARDFCEKRRARLQALSEAGLDPLLVSPFDAELFGHWWFEGPRFLESLFRQVAQTDDFQLVTPGEFLAAHPSQQIGQILRAGAKTASVLSGSIKATPGFIPRSTPRRAP